MAATVRDIGAIPAVKNSERKKSTIKNLMNFCNAYFKHKFYYEWSPDHIIVIGKIERSVVSGGTFAEAMPRGSGKTTIAEIAVIWAIMTGLHRYAVLIGNSQAAANKMFANIKMELSTNPLLLEDFPEVVYPIHKLEGETRRCVGQTLYARRTHIKWDMKKVVFASIAGSRASGSVLEAAGLTGNIRGMLHTTPTGQSIRPSLAILDDPQTDASARSRSQTAKRESIVNGAILGLAGPGKRIAAVMPCTVICDDDLSSRFLDHDTHPDWQGHKTKMVISWPKNDKLWDQYQTIRDESILAGNDGVESTNFYIANRKAMDAGGKVSWLDRYDRNSEASAIQHAMNLKFRDEAAFFAEYQNEPMADSDVANKVTSKRILSCVNGFKRLVIPNDATKLTMFVDVQQRLLYYMIVAWSDEFIGYIVDYGTYPDQKRRYYTLRDIKKTLKTKHKGVSDERAIELGLVQLLTEKVGQEYKREDGSITYVNRINVDAGFMPDSVHAAIRIVGSPLVMPALGRAIGAAHRPMIAYTKKRGERHGHNWYMPTTRGTRQQRHVIADVNYWKTFIHQQFANDDAMLSLWGTQKQAVQHQIISDHIAESESQTRTEGHGRTITEWQLRPSKPDNHFFDCLVGAAVAASMEGIANKNQKIISTTKKRKKLNITF